MTVLDVNARYELEREVGRGGMGTVYRAVDRTTGEVVAVKVLRRPQVRDRLRFNREVGVLSGLHHPAIVRYLGHGELASGKPVLVMEWVEGETLAQRMRMHGLTVAETVGLGLAVADALAFTHDQGVVHRDLKPENILFTGVDDRIKLIDFGIARRAAEALALTRTGMRIGTPSYMSPEQARGLRTVDSRADVFVLGCVLYECATGRRAFAAGNVQALLGKVVLTDPLPISAFAPEAPPELVAVIERMLAKDPEARPRDGAAVHAELAALPAIPAGPARPLVRDPDEPSSESEAVGPTAVQTRLLRPAEAGDRTTFVMLMVPPDDDDMDPEDDTVDDTEREDLARNLRQEAERRGMRVEVLANGSVLGVLSGVEPPGQLAARLAECALAVKKWAPDVSVAFLSDARGSVREPLGKTLDRGFANLEAAALRALTLAQAGDTSVVHVDEATARLLEDRFTVVSSATGYQLVASDGS